MHFTGTHQGELMGVPASGKPIFVRGMTILRFEDDKCVERWSEIDMVGLMAQIGAIPG
jgi:predicted ester cyclase